MTRRRSKPQGKWVFVPNSERDAQELEEEKHRDVSTMLLLFPDRENPFAAVDAYQDYFPGNNKVPDGGAWVLVKNPPFTEYTVPPFSIWYAEPWPHENERHCSHRVKILTPRGELGLYPREYSLITDPGKFYEFVGEGMEIKFFGGEEGVSKDKLFYLRSRGLSKKAALGMLIGEIKAHGVLWIETAREVCAAFGRQWPDEKRLATV